MTTETIAAYVNNVPGALPPSRREVAALQAECVEQAEEIRKLRAIVLERGAALDSLRAAIATALRDAGAGCGDWRKALEAVVEVAK